MNEGYVNIKVRPSPLVRGVLGSNGMGVALGGQGGEARRRRVLHDVSASYLWRRRVAT